MVAKSLGRGVGIGTIFTISLPLISAVPDIEIIRKAIYTTNTIKSLNMSLVYIS
jgi:hypothetical protein